MASSPTVLASSPSAAVGSAPVPTTPKFPVLPLVLAAVLGVAVTALVVGGVVYYLVRSGRLPAHDSSAHKAEAAVPMTTHVMALEPLLVNLADAGGSSYLRVAMTLRVADAATKRDAKPREEAAKDNKAGDEAMAEARDTVLTVLGRQTPDGLLAPDGKERLKAELKAAFGAQNTDLKVVDVFFTDFLVQR
jgi:flagellar protein FliL